MKFIKPLTITESLLTASNVPEAVAQTWLIGTTYAEDELAGAAPVTGQPQAVYRSKASGNTGNALSNTTWWEFVSYVYPAYNAGTTYTIGDIVSDLTNHLLYKAKTSGESGNALTNTDKWSNEGPTNRYKMFGTVVQDVTSRTGPIEVEITPAAWTNSLALVNVNGSSVDIIMTSTAEGEVYNETFDLTSDSGIQDWYAYFFTPIERFTNLFVTGLPVYLDATITVRINSSGTATCGACVIGNVFEIGLSLTGSGVGILDYSVKETDATTGFITVQERAFSARGRFDVLVDRSRRDAVNTALTNILNIPVVWAADEDNASTIIYGYYREFDIVFSDYKNHMCLLQIEGLG
jgi:hypothetical protein